MAKATDIPAASRRAVHERDRGCCRACGRWTEGPHVHHILYRSQQRNHHDPSNLVTLDYACHKMVHAKPGIFREALEAIVEAPGTTALQWIRRNGGDLRGLMGGSL